MKRIVLLGVLMALGTGLALGQEEPVAKPDKVPPGTPPTAASLYRLAFESGKVLTYRDFIRKVPNIVVIREPRDLVDDPSLGGL